MTILTSERGSIGSGLMGIQLEVHRVVIEFGRSPIGSGMTGSAIFAELPGVSIILLMAGETVCRRVLKICVLVT